MSGGGLAADSNGNIFFATGNGTGMARPITATALSNSGRPAEAAFRFWITSRLTTRAVWPVAIVTLASGGLVLLPDLPSGQQLLTQMGKEGKMYLIDRNNMGKYCVNLSLPAAAMIRISCRRFQVQPPECGARLRTGTAACTGAEPAMEAAPTI